MTEPNAVAFELVLCAAAMPNPADRSTVDMRAAGLRHAPSGSPHVAVVFVKVPPARFGETFDLAMDLLDEHGEQVHGPGPSGSVPVCRDFTIEVPQAQAGSGAQVWAGAYAQGAPPLPPGAYQWRVALDGQVRTESISA